MSSFFIVSFDIESLDMLSFGILSLDMVSFDILSLDIVSLDIVSFFMSSAANAAGANAMARPSVVAARVLIAIERFIAQCSLRHPWRLVCATPPNSMQRGWRLHRSARRPEKGRFFPKARKCRK